MDVTGGNFAACEAVVPFFPDHDFSVPLPYPHHPVACDWFAEADDISVFYFPTGQRYHQYFVALPQQWPHTIAVNREGPFMVDLNGRLRLGIKIGARGKDCAQILKCPF